MLKIRKNYENVSVEYTINGIRISKKLSQINQNDIDTAEKYGVNLAKYFEKTDANFVDDLCEQIGNKFTEDAEQVFNSVKYEGVEQKPKRKKK